MHIPNCPVGQWACDRTIILYDMDSLNDNSASFRWRTFRYWAVKATDDVSVIGSSPVGALGNSFTYFDLKTHINSHHSTCKPASILLHVASSLQHPCNNITSIPARIM